VKQNCEYAKNFVFQYHNEVQISKKTTKQFFAARVKLTYVLSKNFYDNSPLAICKKVLGSSQIKPLITHNDVIKVEGFSEVFLSASPHHKII
jgi:hypothetical protein